MIEQTRKIVEESLKSLLDNPVFLPDMQGVAREKAFRSLNAILSTPNHVHKAYIRLPLETGEVIRIPALRVQHNNALGPYKGGVRFHESVNENEVINLALLMTLKNALHNVPFGGGKGGIVTSPKQLHIRDLHELCIKYVRYFSDLIGPDKDIPAPDVGSGEREMDWMMAEYKKIHHGQAYRGSFTGKSVANGGSHGRRAATGKGVYFSFRYLLHDYVQKEKKALSEKNQLFARTVLELSGKPMRVAVQGFGNVGSITALEAYHCKQTQNKVIAVSDRNVTLINEDGLDIPALLAYTDKTRGDLPTTNEAMAEIGLVARMESREFVLTMDTDVLFLAALEEQLHDGNKEEVKARIIVEGANAPITAEADDYFNEKGVVVIPDILANAGGVIVSYLEWLQGRETQFYTEKAVYEELIRKMQETMDTILPQFFNDPFSLRQNCYIHSVMKLSDVLYRQGQLY